MTQPSSLTHCSSAKATEVLLCVSSCAPWPQPQAWSSQCTAGSGEAAVKDWTPLAGHTCIPSWLLHSQVSLSQALGRGLQAPLPKPPYGRGGKETLETSFSTVSTQCFSTFSSPRPPHSPPPSQVHKTAGAFYSKLSQLPDVPPHLC